MIQSHTSEQTPKILKTPEFLSREFYLHMVQIALNYQETEFAREMITNWLRTYPGDLGASYAYCQVLIQEGRIGRAMPILNKLLEIDPEYKDALNLLIQCYKLVSERKPSTQIPPSLKAQQSVLNHFKQSDIDLPGWYQPLWLARESIYSGNLDEAEKQIALLNILKPEIPLIGIVIFQFLSKKNGSELYEFIPILENYNRLWPDCLHFLLYLADTLLSTSDHARGLSLINLVVSKDITGQVSSRLWGINHRYSVMWPENQELSLPAQIPLNVTTHLGIYSLPAGKIPDMRENINIAPIVAAPSIAVINDESSSTIAKLQNKNETTTSQANGRIPVYVLFSVKKALENKYGALATSAIDTEMRRLAKTIKLIPGWSAGVFLADDPLCTQSLGIKSAKPGDAWSLKLAITDLEKALNSRGERIGALLIVGGPDIVPFHNLPNPVSDPDLEVPSDNPYSSVDENYFVPEWPVGRLPDIEALTTTTPANPDFLIKSLREINEKHKNRKTYKSRYNPWLLGFDYWFGQLFQPQKNSFGYAAAVWQPVSNTVFRQIGKPTSLFVSPPYGLDQIEKTVEMKGKETKKKRKTKTSKGRIPPKPYGRLAYFNLHGLSDSGEWYGQKDPQSSDQGPDYPIALRPQDIINDQNGNRLNLPKVIFSEACYGTFIKDKNQDNAISLKFLSAGSQAVVGSTCMAYGSVNTPLIAADLLGHSFWSFINEGFPVGEALQRAKIYLAQTMHNRQGYLDGEDQKTLISFVLFGDPLAQPITQQGRPKPPIRPPENLKEIKTISDSQETLEVPFEVVSHVKSIVARYLPGMSDAKCILNREDPGEGNILSKEGAGHKNLPEGMDSAQRITLSKSCLRENHIHTQIARLTITPQGKLIKLTISR